MAAAIFTVGSEPLVPSIPLHPPFNLNAAFSRHRVDGGKPVSLYDVNLNPFLPPSPLPAQGTSAKLRHTHLICRSK